MINSMTGFGSSQAKISSWGQFCVEIRGTNHKFLDVALHLPDELLSLEERVKKEISAKIKRGRLVCVINISQRQTPRVCINKQLLKNYTAALRNIKNQVHIREGVSLDTLINLPGVLSLDTQKAAPLAIWPSLKILVNQALAELIKARHKEGRALSGFLKAKTATVGLDLNKIRQRFKKVVRQRLQELKADEERSGFLKDTDITEEIERLAFHLANLRTKLNKSGPLGKELDFITQEMQREANTMGAKSCDKFISASVVQIKSHIEKLREQLQNVE